MMRFLVFSFFLLCFAIPLRSAFAASLFFESPQEELGVSQAIEIPILFSSEEARINAIEGEVIFPESVGVEMVITGNSLITYWLEKPILQDGRLRFSGIIPGGYMGGDVELFSLVIRTPHEEELLTFGFNNVHAFLHDGVPTEAFLEQSPLSIQVRRGVDLSQGTVRLLEDVTSPEIFSPEIVQEAHLYDGQYTLLFSAQDKGSGIDYYTVKEGDSDAVIAESPYLIKNQRILQTIEVTAYDLRGNTRTVVVYPENPLSLEVQMLLLLGFIFLLAIIYTIIKRIQFYEVKT